MFIGESVTVLPGAATLVGATATGETAPSVENVGRTMFPPMTALIETTSMKLRAPSAVVGVSAGAGPAWPTHFNWLKKADFTRRVKERHGASARVLDWYAIDPPNQLTCGSCWAFSSSGALGDRQRFESNREVPPLSATYTLSCGGVTEETAGGSPCGGGQVIDGAALALTKGIPGWLAADYSWAETAFKRMVEVQDFSALGSVGSCLGKPEAAPALVGVTVDGPETADQKKAEEVAARNLEKSEQYIRAHFSQPPATDAKTTYQFSGLPKESYGIQAAAAAGGAAPTGPAPTGLTFAKPDTFFLLQDFGAVCEAVYKRGPAMAQYMVPADFMGGWHNGHQAWGETRGVYAHSLELPLYGTVASRKRDLASFKKSAAALFTGDPTNGISTDKDSATEPAQLSMGGHAVVVVGYAVVDLWGAGSGAAGTGAAGTRAAAPPPHGAAPIGGAAASASGAAVTTPGGAGGDADGASRLLQIRPSKGTPFASEHGTGTPVYIVRNSWNNTGPIVDDKQGVWMMVASGQYDVYRNGQMLKESVHLNRSTGFDQPFRIGSKRFGGIVEIDVDMDRAGANNSMVSAVDKLEKFRAKSGDCGCRVPGAAPGTAPEAAPEAAGAAAMAPPASCPPQKLMTASGWVFFALALAILIVALVLSCISANRRPRPVVVE